MSRTTEELKGISHLGSKVTDYQKDYSPEILEAFVNKHPEDDYLVTLNCPEFTCLCPMTGQPDFAKIVINYIPNDDRCWYRCCYPLRHYRWLLNGQNR